MVDHVSALTWTRNSSLEHSVSHAFPMVGHFKSLRRTKALLSKWTKERLSGRFSKQRFPDSEPCNISQVDKKLIFDGFSKQYLPPDGRPRNIFQVDSGTPFCMKDLSGGSSNTLPTEEAKLSWLTKQH